MTPPRRRRSLFTDLTEGVYWFLVIDVLIVLAAVPTLLLWALLPPAGLSMLLFALAALPLLPALAAALYSWRVWWEDRDLIPARRFLLGYRLNAVDSVKVGAPLLLVLGVLGVNITHADRAGTGALNGVFLVLGAVALLLLVRVLSIVSVFSFRTVDVFRLAVYTLFVRPLTTLALVSLGILTVGIILMIGEFMLLVTASLLTFALWATERPVAALLAEQFVKPADPAAAGAAPAGLPREES